MLLQPAVGVAEGGFWIVDRVRALPHDCTFGEQVCPGQCKEPVLFKHLGRNHGRFLWHGAGSDASEHPNQEHAGGAYYHTMCLREREREKREGGSL